MKLKMAAALILTHALVGTFGFALGIYALPILIAPPAPSSVELRQMSSQAQYSAVFKKDLQDSDALHWGKGEVSIGADFISFQGQLAPGPDYKLYLAKEFVETEQDFKRLKPAMVRAGEVKTFENFIVKLSHGINPSDYNTVIIWCETFGQFITAAQYR